MMHESPFPLQAMLRSESLARWIQRSFQTTLPAGGRVSIGSAVLGAVTKLRHRRMLATLEGKQLRTSSWASYRVCEVAAVSTGNRSNLPHPGLWAPKQRASDAKLAAGRFSTAGPQSSDGANMEQHLHERVRCFQFADWLSGSDLFQVFGALRSAELSGGASWATLALADRASAKKVSNTQSAAAGHTHRSRRERVDGLLPHAFDIPAHLRS